MAETWAERGTSILAVPSPAAATRLPGWGVGGSAVTSCYKGMARQQDKKWRGLDAAITRKAPFPAQFLALSSGDSFPLVAWGYFQGAGVPGAPAQVKKGQEND